MRYVNIDSRMLLSYLVLILLGLNGCIKDNVIPPPEIEFENGAELVHYLEAQGDYVNSMAAPALVEAQELFDSSDMYLIIDIRSPNEFNSGHIENAVNVNHAVIIEYLNSVSSGNFSKVVLVSKNGQSAAYYSGLLRMYGFSNVYFLSYGMASWHNDFADEWFSVLKNDVEGFTDAEVPLENLPFYDLPGIEFANPSAAVDEKVKERIRILIQENFSENLSSPGEDSPSIGRDFIHANSFVVCYGINAFYYAKSQGILHPAGAVNFEPPPFGGDFRSSNYLQKLPADKKIIIYSYDGHLSAQIAGYLRVLGYNAASLLFGGNAMVYFSMNGVEALRPYIFSSEKIHNFPYVK